MQLGRENRTVAGKRAVLAEKLVDHQLEPIAGLQVHVEVDVAGEDSRECQGQVDRFARLIHRRHERVGLGANRSAHGDGLRRFLDRLDLRDEVLLVPGRSRDLQQPIAVDLVLEPPECAVEGAREAIRLVDAEAPQIEDGGCARDEFGDFGLANLMGPE